MYTSFRIQNFKGFKDLAFNEGDLARVNLIAGKNNTGKTSVLEAMLIHSGNDSLKATLRATEGQADWQSLFHKFNSESSIDFSARFRVEQSPDLKNDRYRRIESEFWTLSILLEGTVVKAYLNYSEQADQEHNYIDVTSRTASSSSLDIKSYRFTTFGLISLDFVSSTEHTELQPTIQRYSRLVRRKGGSKLLTSVLKNLDSRIEKTEILAPFGETMIFVDIGLDQSFSLSSMGEGMIKITNIVSAMGNAQNGVLLIDEIENGLHYSVLPDVWRAIDEASKLFNVQVFATTHSYEVIRAAHEVFSQDKDLDEEDYDFRYHRLDRRVDNGEIVLTTYKPDTLDFAVTKAWEVR